MYGLTDTDLIGILQHRAEAGVKVSLFYDRSASSTPPPGIEAIALKTKGLMHRKIAVVDETTSWIGSANMTSSSLLMHDNLVIGLYHKQLAQFLSRPQPGPFFFSLNSRPAELWMLPETAEAALNRLIELISSAQQKIEIALFTFTHPQIMEALIQARQRNVQIKLALDYYSGRGASKTALKQLHDQGISILLSQGSQLLHHKWALIDDKDLVFGSANWTKAAFSKNQDCLLIFHRLPRVEKRFMKQLWRSIETESIAFSDSAY
jgi:cardiolipin synthase A/B